MITVCLDTSTASGSAAILRDREVLASATGDSAIPHARRLPADLLRLVDGAGLSIADVDLYAVVTGPGAFTGLRIGIACVQGLAFASGKPAVGISALEASAHAVLEGDRADGLIGVWLDAARREVFTALYEATAGETTGSIRTIEPPAVSSAAATVARWAPLAGSRPVRITGTGLLTYTYTLEDAPLKARIVPVSGVLAATAGRLAYDAHRLGHSGPPHALQPLYVRRPDAELARESAALNRQ